MLKKKYIILLCLAFLMTTAFTSIAFAYSLITYGYADPDVDYYNGNGLGSTYTTPMSGAMSAWNNCSIPCSVSTSSASANYLVTFTQPAYWAGYYSVLASSNDDPQYTATWFEIGMNSDYFPGATANERQSVCVHELGHAMGLNDLTLGSAIMK